MGPNHSDKSNKLQKGRIGILNGQKKDLVEKEKVMKEIMNKSHSANVAHQAFCQPSTCFLVLLFSIYSSSCIFSFSSTSILSLLPSPTPVPLSFPCPVPIAYPTPLLNPQPHLIFLHNTIKMHLISKINNPILLSIIKICTLLFELDLVGKNRQRDHINVLIVVLDAIQHKNAFSLRHQLVKLLFVSSLNSNNSLKNGKLR